jgi:hypothetical protein
LKETTDSRDKGHPLIGKLLIIREMIEKKDFMAWNVLTSKDQWLNAFHRIQDVLLQWDYKSEGGNSNPIKSMPSLINYIFEL